MYEEKKETIGWINFQQQKQNKKKEMLHVLF